MLDKKPKKRITIQKLKTHPFFAEINWEMLLKKKIRPPVILTLGEANELIERRASILDVYKDEGLSSFV